MDRCTGMVAFFRWLAPRRHRLPISPRNTGASAAVPVNSAPRCASVFRTSTRSWKMGSSAPKTPKRSRTCAICARSWRKCPEKQGRGPRPCLSLGAPPRQHALRIRHIEKVGDFAYELVFVDIQLRVGEGDPPEAFHEHYALLHREQAFDRRCRFEVGRQAP